MTRAFALASILLLLAFAMGASCQRDPVTPDNTGGTGGYWPTPPVTGGAAGIGGSSGSGGAAPVDVCEAAEWRLKALECRTDAGVPLWATPAGTPFATVCRAREADGDSMCPHCIAEIESCDVLELCRPRSPGVCR
jgi:hypothetical protein